MGARKKKFEKGEATLYISRKQALKKLQLSLRAFRYLCILKGIYPREPRKWKRAQKGVVEKKTLYYKKDIQFLLHEPVVWKLRALKVHFRKKAKAKNRQDTEKMQRLKENHPVFCIDHIVRERYPTFIDAIRDLDDCLTLCFLFSTFPALKVVQCTVAHLCRKLTTEFLHYVIEARALRKAFISIKGYYFQAEIKGQLVTWIAPHHFGFQPQHPSEVDFKVMSHFVEFYTTLLGFINFRLYHSLNMFYPPKLHGCSDLDAEKELATPEELLTERVAALNQSVRKSQRADDEDEVEADEFPLGDNQDLEEAKKAQESLKRLKKLFQGMKFFLNREVPREPLTFVIRALGGQVSWDSLLFVGATYNENDETITHHIVDRPSMEKQYLSRYYVQPQWVFDCLNSRRLLPAEDYFMGAVLPVHLSPFVEEKPGDYVPPERKLHLDQQGGVVSAKRHIEEPEEEGSESEEEEEKEKAKPLTRKQRLKQFNQHPSAKKIKMAVKAGELVQEDPEAQKKQEERETYGLRVMMIKKKQKQLYSKIMRGTKHRQREARLLSSKREQLDKQATKEKRKAKRLQRN